MSVYVCHVTWVYEDVGNFLFSDYLGHLFIFVIKWGIFYFPLFTSLCSKFFKKRLRDAASRMAGSVVRKTSRKPRYSTQRDLGELNIIEEAPPAKLLARSRARQTYCHNENCRCKDLRHSDLIEFSKPRQELLPMWISWPWWGQSRQRYWHRGGVQTLATNRKLVAEQWYAFELVKTQTRQQWLDTNPDAAKVLGHRWNNIGRERYTSRRNSGWRVRVYAALNEDNRRPVTRK